MERWHIPNDGTIIGIPLAECTEERDPCDFSDVKPVTSKNERNVYFIWSLLTNSMLAVFWCRSSIRFDCLNNPCQLYVCVCCWNTAVHHYSVSEEQHTSTFSCFTHFHLYKHLQTHDTHKKHALSHLSDLPAAVHFRQALNITKYPSHSLFDRLYFVVLLC